MSIEAQLDRLNANLESLVGAIAANTSVAASLANVGANTNNAKAPAPPPAEKPTRTRRTKEEIAADAAAASEIAPVAVPVPAPAPAVETQPEDTQAAEDPFSVAPESEAPAYTLDNVREAALALKDATSLEVARKFIAGFGVDTVKDLPPAKFADFITRAKAETKKNAI